MGDRGGVAGWRAGRLLRTREADVEVGGGGMLMSHNLWERRGAAVLHRTLSTHFEKMIIIK